MRWLAAAAFLVAPGWMFAEGSEPKAKPTDYPAHVELGKYSLAAEYMIHSFTGGGQTFIANDYLVVEVALYAPKGERIAISDGQFTLRVNGRKQALLAQAPALVAASLQYPDWQQTRPRLEAGVGMGNGEIIVGRPQQVGRFPGDPTTSRLPKPPQAPEQENPSGQEKAPPVKAEEAVVGSALPEGDRKGPVSGYLYFAYKGKITSIRALELIYTGPAGSATLKLL